MGFPVIIDPSLPPDSETPKAGALRIRNLTQAIADLFGLPTAPTAITGPLFITDASGHVTLAQGAAGSLLTNKTGGTLLAGNVVSLDAANDSAVALLDVSGALAPFVVALATIAPNAQGAFATQAVVSKVSNAGVITRGHYIRKSGTSLSVEDAGALISSTLVPPRGSIGVALTGAAGAGTIAAYLFGSTYVPPVWTLSRQAPGTATGANTTETVLATATVPANTISVQGKALTIQAWGSYGANGNTKTVRLYWGAGFGAGSAVIVTSQVASNAGAWDMTARIINTAHLAQTAFGKAGVASQTADAAFTGRAVVSDPTKDETAQQLIEVTGQNGTATASDIVCKGFEVYVNE